jgi:hypothetical protein
MLYRINIFGTIASIASILGFFAPFFSTNQTEIGLFQYIMLGIFALLTLSIIGYNIISSPKVFKDPKSINKYMLKWISKNGRIVIFTRDMSWADDNEIKNILFTKVVITS